MSYLENEGADIDMFSVGNSRDILIKQMVMQPRKPPGNMMN